MDGLSVKVAGPNIVLLLIILISVVRIADTYRIFTHTWDEPAHIAAGLELLDHGTYSYEQQHPPLARMAVAVGPYLDGKSSQKPDPLPQYDFWKLQFNMFREGRRLLYEVGPYDRVLTLGRLGNLPFAIIALLATYAWARWLFGDWPAILAVFFLATVPPVLGHAGLATLDMAPVAFGIAGIFAFCRFMDRPRAWEGLGVGALSGAALMAKFSAIPFLGLSFTAIAAWRGLMCRKARPPVAIVSLRHLTSGMMGVPALLLVVWLSYGLSVGPLVNPDNRPYEMIEDVFGDGSLLSDILSDAVELPVYPTFIKKAQRGIEEVLRHNSEGHRAFLLGEVRWDGWWHFYMVALGVKTPVPLLLLGLPGLGLLLRKSLLQADWRLAAPTLSFAAILLFVSIYSQINIGVRHVLILYPLLAIGATYAVVALLRTRLRKAATISVAAALVFWQFTASVYAHPDNMSYFNFLAGSRPEKVLVVGDLDWGQDLARLERELRRRGIERVAISYYGSARLSEHDLPEHQVLEPETPRTGWIAISLWHLASSDEFDWLREYEPVVRVGTSINLYHIAK